MCHFPTVDCSSASQLWEKLNLTKNQTLFVDSTSAWDFSLPSFISGVVGNALALLVLIASWKKQHKTVFYKLIFALIFVDLMGQLLTSPFVLRLYVNGRNWTEIGGSTACHFYSFNMLTAVFNTIFMTAVIATERCLALKKPFLYERVVRPHHAYICIFFVFSSSCFIGLLPTLGLDWLGTNVIIIPYTWSFFDSYDSLTFQWFPYIFSIVGLCAIAITAVGNVLSVLTLCQMRKYRLSFTSSTVNAGENALAASDRKADAEMMALATALFAFACFWAPLMFCVLVNQVAGGGFVESRTILYLVKLASVNQVLDPWFYILFRIFFHDKFLSFCGGMKDVAAKWLRCCCHEDELRQNKMELKRKAKNERHSNDHRRKPPRRQQHQQSPNKIFDGGSSSSGSRVIAVVDQLLQLPKHSHSNHSYHPSDSESDQFAIPLQQMNNNSSTGRAGRMVSGVAGSLSETLVANGYIGTDVNFNSAPA